MGGAAQPRGRELTREQVRALMTWAEERGLVHHARKTKPVDARPANPGEVIETAVAGEGKEVRSRPAKAGDWVVRNRSAATGNEQYLVSRAAFAKRYESTGKPAEPDGWQEHRPLGKVMRFFVLPPEHEEFHFEAPWGEKMRARPGDAILQDPDDPGDTYRVAAAAFAGTYEVLD
ncbi:MAG TPA: hypothetical protein VLF95_07625 [Vicinamibacteria bacterium]|nr:hypothetical protein [Vicinamibacteria bacterium]